MKLSRLLIGLISLLWLIVFVATLYVVVNSTRDYLSRATQAHAQDTATSLGLSLTQTRSFNDPVAIELMTSAIFDRGYYSEIEVKKISGESLFKKHVEQAAPGVPSWFIRWFDLPTPRMKAIVMDGWRKAAQVEVESHPGYAYAELWAIAKKSFWVLLAVAALSLLAVMTVLRLALSPLSDMERQAEDIAHRRFTLLQKLPWARELHHISRALNGMCQSVERMLTDQARLTEQMREKAYVDPVTGLMNRNDFSEKLNHLIATSEEFGAGLLALVRVNGFAAYNSRYGRSAGDALLQRSAQLLRSVAGRREHALLARMDGPEFAMMVPHALAGELPMLGEALVQALAEIEEFPRGSESVMAHVGLAHYQHSEGATFGKLMQNANLGLSVARSRGLPGWAAGLAETEPGASGALVGEIDALFAGGIDAVRVKLQYQPVRACNDDAAWRYRNEALVRITADDGTLIPAGLFLPVVRRRNQLIDLDRIVVAKVIERIASGGPVGSGVTAVNLSAESISSPDFVNWLCASLEQQPQIARHLVFELSEYAIVSRIETVRQALQRLRRAGAGCAIDHFGQSTASVGFLRSLDVDYIKIDGSYTRGIMESAERQFLVQALVGIAHGLRLNVIAEYVETEQEFQAVKALMVDGVQGYYVGKPH
jgi:diguanylate cyclase (GGDEF)-like protein